MFYMRSYFQYLFFLPLLILSLLMTSCVAPIKEAKPKQGPQPLEQIKPGGHLYKIDNKASQVLIKVNKTGTLAFFGHNHLLLVKELQGTIHLYDSIAESRVYIRFPVVAIKVDPSDLRKQGGEDYIKPIGKKDKQATYRNMLSNKVLGTEVFPFVTLGSVRIIGTEPALIMTTSIQIRDQTRVFDIPINIERADNYLCVRGKFSFRQTDFAITPFSVFMGSLRVTDELNVDFKVCANRQDANAV